MLDRRLLTCMPTPCVYVTGFQDEIGNLYNGNEQCKLHASLEYFFNGLQLGMRVPCFELRLHLMELKLKRELCRFTGIFSAFMHGYISNESTPCLCVYVCSSLLQ